MMQTISEAKIKPSKWRRIFSRDRSQSIFTMVFVIPALVAYLCCFVYPIFESFYTSFFNWNGFSDKVFVGLNNYLKILKDSVFYKAIQNDIWRVLGQEILIVPITILFAVSVTRLRLKKVEASIYRYLFYLPNILSVSITGIVWAFIYDPYNGLLNAILKMIGLGHVIPKDGWLVQYTMPSIIVVATWAGIGYYMILLISAINSISKELYEAADVDGAGQWQQLWSITMPAVWEQVRFIVVRIIMTTLSNYTLAMLLANGGVDGSGMVMGLYVYSYGLDSLSPKVGYANAAAVILLVISSVLTLITNKFMTREED